MEPFLPTSTLSLVLWGIAFEAALAFWFIISAKKGAPSPLILLNSERFYC